MIIGTILIPKKDEPGMLVCPECGIPYPEKDTAAEEQMEGKFKQTKTKIISGKKRNKKYYDKQSNEITDPDLIADIQRGATTVTSYREEKSGKERHFVHK
jgi:DNA-directed RNA polymerase subunit M/transcription elongation factor TFIIS